MSTLKMNSLEFSLSTDTYIGRCYFLYLDMFRGQRSSNTINAMSYVKYHVNHAIKTYIGETGRSFTTQKKEHKKECEKETSSETNKNNKEPGPAGKPQSSHNGPLQMAESSNRTIPPLDKGGD